MGVYIKGMEMPKNCGDCKAFVCYRQWAGDVGDCFCGITKNDAEAKKKNADCPLVHVPPHGRLIDADALRAKQQEDADLFQGSTAYGDKCRRDEAMNAVANIVNAPTIIPADPAENGE